MLRRLFAKEAFEVIEKELENVYQRFGIQHNNLKVKKQPATYSKPYNYIVEGHIENYSFVLSLHHSPLKERVNKKQLEFILHCDNPDWIALVFRKRKTITSKKMLEQIDVLEAHNLNKLIIEANNKELAKKIFDTKIYQQAAILEVIKFTTFSLERKRLYIQLPWLPDDFNKREFLAQLIELGKQIVKAVDKK